MNCLLQLLKHVSLSKILANNSIIISSTLTGPSSSVEWADLPIVDLSEAQTVEGRLKLAVMVRDAMTNSGFFYAVNHGYTPDQVCCCLCLFPTLSYSLDKTSRIFDIANVAFDQVDSEEKKRYEGRPRKTGSYQGYKLRTYWVSFLTEDN